MSEFEKMMKNLREMAEDAEAGDGIDYLLNIEDYDGDRFTIAKPYHDDTLMLRIENDDLIAGFIVNAPRAMAIVGCLMKLIEEWDFKKDIQELKKDADYLDGIFDDEEGEDK
ncbi:MAG: hypothetical protein AMJ59_12775 [Gammaproteobacteria bacterium SG8_31]|nr:MAG: hypothetical protein AMJ59_12775 [Gammaproteobacteria bacterium SG8_31]